MPKFHKDEVAKLEDIEALLVTARDLSARFKCPKLEETAGSIRSALTTLRSAKNNLIDEWRAIDNREVDPAIANDGGYAMRTAI